MELEDLDNSIIGCTICHAAYSLAIPKQRPHVLSCGHTFCGKCLEADKRKCHICRKVSSEDASLNYQLEDQLKSIHQYRESFAPQPLKHLSMMQICLDCKIPVLKSEAETMSLLHTGHEIVSCEGRAETQLKFIFWLLDIFNRGCHARTKFEKILQSILYVAAQYQKGLKIFIEAAKEPKFEDNIMDSLRLLLKADPAPTTQIDSNLIGHLKKMRMIESDLGSSIHKLAHKCSTLQKDNLFLAPQKIYNEMYADLANDDEKGLHIMPNRKQLAILPELQSRVISTKTLVSLRRNGSSIPLIEQSLIDSDF